MAMTQERLERQRAYVREYKKTERGRETERRYNTSPKGKASRKKRNVKWRHTPEGKAKRAEYERRRRRTPRGRLSQKRCDWRARLKKNYGLTETAWTEMLVGQAGRCASCSEPMTDPHVDHDHGTGRVRELLCAGCNTAAGHIESERFQLVVEYLRRHSV